jgi:group I intron endonuclease
MESGIYLIKNIVNNKIYIGSAKDINRRWVQHKSSLRLQTHHSKKLQNGFNKYGVDAFVYSIVELCSEDAMMIKEQYWIDLLTPWYNVSLKAVSGGTTLKGKPWPEARRRAQDNHPEGWKPKPSLLKRIHKPHSEETKAKLSAKAKLRKPISEQTREKMRLSKLGNQNRIKSRLTP